MDLMLSQAAAAAQGQVKGADVALRGFCLDSRQVRTRELFIALAGDHVDGHDFVEQAGQQGAAAALVARHLPVDLPQIVVDDVTAALGRIARHWRDQLAVRVVGITGSNGKTTVKEMIAAILSRVGPTLATRGNYNNELGVPLTLGRLEGSHRFAVVEMGCGQPGDIRYLAELARPAIGVVTNAGPAHLERLGTVEGVARTKGELFASLPDDGVAVINRDDDFADYWSGISAHCRQLGFGRGEEANVRDRGGRGQTLVMDTPVGTIETRLALPGAHNRMNALAAAAAAIALEIPSDEIAAGLAAVRSLPGRLEAHATAAGWTLIDDTYNANPASLYAGLRVVSESGGEAWLVLGDMAELGEESEKMHAEMGQSAADLGVKRLFAVGRDSSAAVVAFGPGAKHFESHAALADKLKAEVHEGVVCLVKGSRSSAMETIVQKLIGEGG
jgi:UDP-N-acetylmuramoyl-tripeptide--D-alanyl-D-alanine ligase